MKRTLVITSEFPPGPGGIGQHAASLVLTLSNKCDVDVLCNQDYVSEEEIHQFNHQLPTNVSVHRFASRGSSFASIKRAFQAFKLMRSGLYERVIVSGLLPLWIGGFLKLTTRSVIHGFVHGNEVNLQKLFRARVTRWAYGRLDYLYPVSTFTQSFLTSTNPSQQIKVIPNGLDHAFLAEADVFQEKPITKLQGIPALLTVGNVSLRKGQHRVVRALPAILKRYPGAHYHIVGLPTRKDEIVKLATQLDVLHAITFHGRLPTRNELYKTYKAADIFIMLSESQPDGDIEGFGIAILEANAFGIPAIGALGCGIEDAISSDSGVLVNGDSAREVVDAINTLSGNKEYYEKGAKAWAKQHDWGDIVQMIEQ